MRCERRRASRRRSDAAPPAYAAATDAHPLRPGERRAVLPEARHHLHAQRQALRPLACRHRHAGHVQGGPKRVEDGIAGPAQPLWRLARRGRCQQGVEGRPWRRRRLGAPRRRPAAPRRASSAAATAPIPCVPAARSRSAPKRGPAPRPGPARSPCSSRRDGRRARRPSAEGSAAASRSRPPCSPRRRRGPAGPGFPARPGRRVGPRHRPRRGALPGRASGSPKSRPVSPRHEQRAVGDAAGDDADRVQRLAHHLHAAAVQACRSSA